MCLDETDEISGFDAISLSQSKTKRAKSESSDMQDRPPVVIVIDTAHRMDPASWMLYETIRDECSRIAIILCI